MLHTDNGKEFANNTLSSWLENRGIRHVLEGKYHPQVKVQLKVSTRQYKDSWTKHLQTQYLNWEENKWSLPLMITDFLFLL